MKILLFLVLLVAAEAFVLQIPSYRQASSLYTTTNALELETHLRSELHRAQQEFHALQDLKRQLYLAALRDALVHIHAKYEIIHQIRQLKQDLIVLSIERAIVEQQALHEAAQDLRLQITQTSLHARRVVYERQEKLKKKENIVQELERAQTQFQEIQTEKERLLSSSSPKDTWVDVAGAVADLLLEHFASLPQILFKPKREEKDADVPFFATLDKEKLQEEWRGPLVNQQPRGVSTTQMNAHYSHEWTPTSKRTKLFQKCVRILGVDRYWRLRKLFTFY